MTVFFKHSTFSKAVIIKIQIFVEVLNTAKEMAQALAEDDINDISDSIRQKAEVACEYLYDIIDRMEE